MSGTAINPPGGVCGSEVGKGWKHSDIREARPSHLDLVRKKLVPFVASIAFLLTVLVTFPVFSQVPAGTLSGIVTSESGSRIPNAHLSIRNTRNGKTVLTNGKEDGSYSVLPPLLRVSSRHARPWRFELPPTK